VVSDGGFDTVQRALRHAKPLVLTGRSADQLEGNTRVAATGAALYLATDKPSDDDIEQAVRIVLTDPTYRGNARRLAAEYARLDALGSITDTVSSYLRD
jgi:UDP:flavonoid glycosyltransferase YjiC (YdhE family)